MENKVHKPVLSISLLCAGKKPEETRKSLDSLLTIKEKIDTEIIIVDTGCDDSMKEMIGRYADQIIPFSWCDDFAKARNAGLSECSGEWFMYIDDDEWFDDTTAIASFFNSGEYRDYDYAGYYIRNYYDSEGSDYDNFFGARLSRLTSDTRFEGKIHEYLTTCTGKFKRLDCFAHHYGYVFRSPEEHFAKAMRNIKPLREMIKEDPGNLHWYQQLEQELISIKEILGLQELCEDMIQRLDKYDEPEINKIRGDFYYGKLQAEIQSYQYDETITDYNKYRKDRRNNDLCRAAMDFIVSVAFYEKKDYERSLNYSQKYADIYLKLKGCDDSDSVIDDMSTLNTRDVFDRRHLYVLLSALIVSGIKLNRIEVVHKFFPMLDKVKTDGSQFDLIFQDLVSAFAEKEYDEGFIEYAETMLSYKSTAEKCTHLFMSIEEQDKKEHKGHFDNLIRVLGQTKNGSNYYLHYIRMRYEARYGSDRNRFLKLYESLILLTNDFFNLDESVWQIADEKEIGLGRIFKEIPVYKWKTAVDGYVEKHWGKDSANVRKMMSRFDGDDDIRFRYYRLKALEADILHDDPSAAAVKLADYSRECESFYRRIYRSGQFKEKAESSVLPPECQFAMQFNAASESGKFDECEGLYPPFDKALDEYIRQAWENYQYRLRADKRRVLVYSADMKRSPDAIIEKIKSILFYFSHFSDRILFIWHSEPFSDRWNEEQRKEYESIRDSFIKEGWGIYDTSEDTGSLFSRADAFYGSDEAMLEYADKHEKAAMKEKTSTPVTSDNVVFGLDSIPYGLPEHMTIIQENRPTDIAEFRQMLELGRLKAFDSGKNSKFL